MKTQLALIQKYAQLPIAIQNILLSTIYVIAHP